MQNPDATPRATSCLTSDSHHSFCFSRSNTPSLISSSVAGNLLWFPFLTWSHPQRISKISPKFPLCNSSHYPDSNTNKHSLGTHMLSRTWEQTGKLTEDPHNSLLSSNSNLITLSLPQHCNRTSAAVFPSPAYIPCGAHCHKLPLPIWSLYPSLETQQALPLNTRSTPLRANSKLKAD